MIQDLREGAFSLAYSPVGTPTEEDYLMVFEGRNVLAARDGAEVKLPTLGELAASEGKNLSELAGKLRFLFTVSGREYFLYREEGWDGTADAAGTGVSVPGYGFEPVRIFRECGPKELCFAGETAWQLYGWYRDNRFCGRCGCRTVPGTKERNVICPSCGNTVYPKIMPAVIVGVTNGDRILMTRYAGREYGGYALVAGFCEIGETGEDTVRREVMEETGVRVKNIRYYKSQPWGFDSDLLLGYFCELDGDGTITMDPGELSVASWVPRQDIHVKNEDMSLTNEMICCFREGRIPR